MNKFTFTKTESRYSQHCVVCGKLHKRGYEVDSYYLGQMRNWIVDRFICSKKCQNMYMLQNL